MKYIINWRVNDTRICMFMTTLRSLPGITTSNANVL